VEELIGRVKGLKKDADVYSGELTAEAIKRMIAPGFGRPGFGRRGGGGGDGGGPDTSGVKGTASFWVKDGMIAKYETRLEGKMTGGRDNRERDIRRTRTVEIKDVGTTKVAVPAEAKKKLSKG
jgi:hypothetical protein